MTQVIQLILSLSILVFIHELGHFLAAKMFKMKVEKFYLFFNPWFSLFKIKKGETEYGIGWLPLGGYVKIAGMIDESMDKEQLKKPPQPWEFRAKPAWQRFIVMIAGVLFNFILAVIIYIGIALSWGEQYIPTNEVKGIMVDSLGQELGLRNGDRIIAVNGKSVKKFFDITKQLILNEPHNLTVIRNNDTITIDFSGKKLEKLLQHQKFIITPRLPMIISDFTKNSVAKKHGLKKGDKIIGFNGYKINFFDQLKDSLQKHKLDTITLTILRNKDTIKTSLVVPKSGKIGVYPEVNLAKFYRIKTIHYNFWQAIPKGFQLGIDGVNSMLKQLKLLITPKTGAYKSVGSFISIGRMFSKTWDWQIFWRLTAFLSIMLAVLNLLPIPGLDGGHAVFALYEMITGRKPSDKFLEIMQIIGFILLLMLILLALGNDLMRYVFK